MNSYEELLERLNMTGMDYTPSPMRLPSAPIVTPTAKAPRPAVGSPSNPKREAVTQITDTPLKLAGPKEDFGEPYMVDANQGYTPNPVVAEALMKKFEPQLIEEPPREIEQLPDRDTGEKEEVDKLPYILQAISKGFLSQDPTDAIKDYRGDVKSVKDRESKRLEQARKMKMEDFAFGRDQITAQRDDEKYSPNSRSSRSAKRLIETEFPKIKEAYGEDWNLITDEDVSNILDVQKMKAEIEHRKEQQDFMRGTNMSNQQMKREELDYKIKDSDLDRQLKREEIYSKRDERDLIRDEKRSEKEKKRAEQMFEVEDRKRNINDALTLLEGKIKKDGTWQALGSHNQDIDRLVDQIATDMSKLMDPNSVARPSEVELVKQGLIQSGFKNRNSTALDILKNFRGEVDRRAENAYKIRGIDKPLEEQRKEGGAANEIKRRDPKSGKIIVYDAVTKKPLRAEE